MKTSLVLILSFVITISACSKNKDELKKHSKSENSSSFIFPDTAIKQPDTNRWFTKNQLDNGEKTFVQICSACHQNDASGTKNWKESKDGVFPPPPLNGNGHAWHHSLPTLHSTIKNGTASLGGNMPAWGKVLTDEKILETIAFFQSKWSDDVYVSWLNMNSAK